jgi:hypothetical protein
VKPVLDRVTITGADDSIKPEDLVPLSKEFPFVEWGILASDHATIKSGGRQRYPSPAWIQSLQNQLWTGGVPRLSLHINGQWVRDLLLGKLTIPGWLPWLFARIQLNFHAERNECDPHAFLRAMSLIYGRQFIFQVDGRLGNKHLAAAVAADAQLDEDVVGALATYDHPVVEMVGLFDVSDALYAGGGAVVFRLRRRARPGQSRSRDPQDHGGCLCASVLQRACLDRHGDASPLGGRQAVRSRQGA